MSQLKLHLRFGMCFLFCCRSTLHCEIFPLKQKALVAIANTHTTMKVGDVNKENQIKLNFYNFNEEKSVADTSTQQHL